MISKLLTWLGVLVSKQDQYYELKVAGILILTFLFLVWVIYVSIWIWKSIQKIGVTGTWSHSKETLGGLFYVVCFFGGVVLVAVFFNWLSR